MANKYVTLKSSDGEIFKMHEEAVVESKTLKTLIANAGITDPIPLLNVSSKILVMVIKYCEYHAKNEKTGKDELKTSEDEVKAEDAVEAEDKVKAWGADFVKVDVETLFELILAANYLDIKNLLNLTNQTVVDMMKGKDPEWIRETFHIKNDFTPEAEEAIRKNNKWEFE